MSLARFIPSITFCLLLMSTELWGGSISNLTKNDPYPMFSVKDPTSFLTERERNYLYGCEELPYERINLSISPFRQTADDGYRGCGDTLAGLPVFQPLGNLNGTMNMLALLYDPASRAKTLVAINPTPVRSQVTARPLPSTQFVTNEANEAPFSALQEADLPPYVSQLSTINLVTDESGNYVNPELVSPMGIQQFNQLINPINTDMATNFGSYSIAQCYRKYGARFETHIQIIRDIGFSMQLSVADIRVDPRFTDLTCSAFNPSACPDFDQATPPNLIKNPSEANYVEPQKNFMRSYMMSDTQRAKIARTFGLNLDSYHVTGVEDLRLGLYARHLFPIYGRSQSSEYNNRYDCVNNKNSFADFIFMPFVHAQVGLAVEPLLNQCQPLGAPLGNNGHNSVGFDTGFDIDFFDTVKIGFDGGFTHFFPRTVCNFRLPTDQWQNGFFPFMADVNLSPGNNWHFAMKLAAYHFLGNLSFYTQFIKVNHAQDRICVLRSASKEKNAEDFLPERVERKSLWQSSLINASLYYDISSNFALGVLWQPTVGGRNVYRVGTLLGSLVLTY